MAQTQSKNDMPAILTLCLAALIGVMNTTIFNVALPALIVYFDTDVTTVQWLSSGFMLAAGIVTPAVAFFGESFGYRRLLLVISAASIILSVAGSMAWCIEMLIVVRILFGVFTGMLMPLSMALTYRIVPPANQPKAAGMLSMAFLIGGALPAVLSGAIITYGRWQYLLWLMVPLCLLLFILCLKVLPADNPQRAGKLDTSGFIITGLGSFVLLFAFSNLSKWGVSVPFIGLVIVGLALIGIYAKTRWNRSDAMLNLEILRYPRYVAAILVDIMTTIAMYMITFSMPLFLQSGMGYSAAITGMIMLPCSLVSMVAMPFGTKVLASTGEKGLALSGIFVLAAGTCFFLHPTVAMPLILIVIGMSVRSFGLGFMSMLATNASMSAVPPAMSGHASSLLNWEKQLIGSLTTSITGNFIALRLLSHNAVTPEAISSIYCSSTGYLMTGSLVLLLCIIPISLKYFRGKKEMQAQQ